jgi:hypothetical protein
MNNGPFHPGDIITLFDGRLASIVRVEHLQRRGMGNLFEWHLTVVTGNSQQLELYR